MTNNDIDPDEYPLDGFQRVGSPGVIPIFPKAVNGPGSRGLKGDPLPSMFRRAAPPLQG